MNAYWGKQKQYCITHIHHMQLVFKSTDISDWGVLSEFGCFIAHLLEIGKQAIKQQRHSGTKK